MQYFRTIEKILDDPLPESLPASLPESSEAATAETSLPSTPDPVLSLWLSTCNLFNVLFVLLMFSHGWKKNQIFFPYLTAQRLEVLTDIGVHHAVQMQVAALPESDQLKLLCLEISQYQFFALQTLLGNLRIKTVSCIFLQS